MSSEEVSLKFDDASLYLIYIDISHDYENVKKDILKL